MVEKNKINVSIGRPIEFQDITDEGVFKKVLTVPYTLDGRHYEVTVDKEGSTPESIEAAVKEDAKRILAVKDKTITL